MGFWDWLTGAKVTFRQPKVLTSTPAAPVLPPDPDVEDLLKRIDVTALYPWFAKKMRQLHVNCRKRGHDFYAISGYRSPKEQEDLYALGRTKKVAADGSPQKIVTNARPGRSAHNYGGADDGCKDADATRAGLQPDWNIESYTVWAEEGRKLNLEMGYFWVNFKEGPHAQMPLKQHWVVSSWDNLWILYKTGGIPAVWAEFDKHNWDAPEDCVECAKYK